MIMDKLKNKLIDKKLAFFVGAGIDYHSGVPLVKGEHGIITTILNKLPLNDEDSKLILDNNKLPFESFFSTLGKHTDIDELLNIFNIGDINTNHIFLAKLAKFGLLKTIVTTNFTQLIEKAFMQEGLKEGVDFDVIYNDEEMQNIDYIDEKIKLIKIHGCVSDKDSLVITIEKIANRTSLNPRKNIIDYLFNSGAHDAICILGYSCSDVFDITPFVKETSANKEVLFINHSFPDWDNYDTQQHVNSVEDKDIFENIKDGIWFNYDTDEIIKQLWDSVYESTNSIEKYKSVSVDDRERSIKQKEVLVCIDKWIQKIDKKQQYEKPYYISGELLNNISYKNNALKYYERLLSILKKKNKPFELSKTLGYLTFLFNSINDNKAYQYAIDGLGIADEINSNTHRQIHYKNLAVYYRKNAQMDKSIETFTKALSLNMTDSKDIGKVYMELGITYKQIEKYRLANENFQKALVEFENNGSITDQGWALGNIGNIYFHQFEDYMKAEEIYKRALYLADKMANKVNQQVWNGNLGNLYLSIQNYDEAYEYLVISLRLAREVMDKAGEGRWLNNLSEYYYKTGNKDKAIEYLQKSIDIAKKWDKINVDSRIQALQEYMKIL